MLKGILPVLATLLFIPMLNAQYNCMVSCKSYVEISAGHSCNPTIHPWQVLSNYQTQCNYQVTVFAPSGYSLGNSVPSSFVGQTLNYSVVSGGSFCMGSIKVVDDLAPIAICDLDTRVSLSSGGSARVNATAFDDGSYDNCGLASVLIARKVPGNCPPGIEDDTQFRPYVEVCCNDIYSSPLQVRLKVTDHSGNTNECWAELYVDDKLPPSIKCPSDITISCDYDYFSGDFSDFGKVVTDPASREIIVINDPFYAPDFVAGLDGIATDNCGVSVSELFTEQLDCGQGTIKRTFTAKDPGGLTTSCTQTITIIDLVPFNETNIIWPADVHLNECPNGNTDPETTGKPIFTGDHCSIIGTSYKDWVFTVAEGACFKILRKWSVLDWCQYIPNKEPVTGLWSYTQVIKVQTMNSPVFDDCDPVEFCGQNSSGCSGNIIFVKNATDDCTPDSLLNWSYMIDLGSTGRYEIVGQGNDISGSYPFGTHRVRWTVQDLCGNSRVCVQTFTVKDCKEPSPVCYHGLSSVVMPISGELTLHAEVFDAASFDNCTPSENLRFAFSNNPSDSLKTFTCDNLDSTEVEIWVFDESGNSDFCRTYIVLRDNHGACLDSLITFTSGLVFDPNRALVSDVDIHFTSDDMPYVEGTNTDQWGGYDLQWYLIPDYANGTIGASKNDNPLNGVTSFDLLLIQKHITGLREFTTMEQYIAADINNDGLITVEDIWEGRRLILGNQTEFSNNNSWRIFPEVFSLKEQAAGAEYPPEEIRYSIFKDSVVIMNFDAVKIGDVNGSARASANSSEQRSLFERELFWTFENIEGAGRISVGSQDLLHAASLQFTMQLDIPPHIIYNIDFSGEHDWHYNVLSNSQGQTLIAVSLFDKSGFSLESGSFMQIELDLDESQFAPALRLVDFPATAELAELDGAAQTVSLTYLDIVSEESTGIDRGIEIKVIPNPGSGPFSVFFRSESSINGSYIITDGLGRELINGSILEETGNYELQFDNTVLPHSGFLYLRFIHRVTGQSETVKILRL